MGAPGSNSIESAYDLVDVTKSDATADPNGPFRGLHVGSSGIIKLTMPSGRTVTFTDGELAIGQIHAIRFTRVWSAVTTATVLRGVK